MSDQLWNNAAQVMNSAGYLPIPVTDTVIEILNTIMTEEQAEFILHFDKALNWDELKAKCGFEDQELENMLNDLMNNGVVTGIPSSRTGVMVYRLMPPFPGVFEYTLMRGETTEKEKKLARLFDQLFGEISDLVQSNYDQVVLSLKSFPPLNRIVPVESQLGEQVEVFFPSEEVNAIIDKNDTIGVAHCYCRHEKDLLNHPCKVTDKRENCLVFGKSATFAIDHKYAKKITKAEAKIILREAADDGLVHKAFHAKLNPEKVEDAICNCCSCCCGTFQIYYRGAAAIHSITSHIAEVNGEECVSCGVCIDICPMEAINMDDIAMIDTERCLGCGVCAHQCDLNAISLKRTGPREVFVQPPKMS